jgi:hypothetical protein
MTTTEQQTFIQHLALALTTLDGGSASEATMLAERFYAQAWHDYCGPGQVIYGPSHAGLMRWMLEQLPVYQSASPPLSAKTSEQ